MKKFKSYLIKYGALVVASICTAVALELIFIPNHVVYGTVAGVATLISILFSAQSPIFYAGWWLLFINVPLLIFAFVQVNKKFSARTIIYVVLTATIMLLLRYFNVAQLIEFNETDVVAWVLIGGALSGLALPLMLFVNGSTGGSDVIGLLTQLKLGLRSQESFRLIMLMDSAVIVISSIVLKDVTVLVYSISALFVSEIVKEYLFRGFSANLELEITTDKAEEMSEKLSQGMQHGTTIIKGIGGYSKQEKSVVICIINKRQLTKARKIIAEVDASAFAYVENVREVIGRGFLDKEAELNVELAQKND